METSKLYQLLDGRVEEKRDSDGKDGFKIYHIQWEETFDAEGGFRVFSIGQPSNQPTKCVLLVGVTGAGKTTLVSGVLNNFLGVSFEDPFRLQVKEDTGREMTQSQTDFITVYTIYYKEGMKHKYNLVLIDSPGLEDTRAEDQPRDITHQFEEFIASDLGVGDLHCVGLVCKATTNRELKSEKTLLEEIISLLGEAVPEITHIFATFACDEPLVEAVVKNAGVKYKSMFQFDNGMLFSPTSAKSDKELISLSHRWDKMREHYDAWFGALTNAFPLSLELIRERKYFDTCKKNLKAQIENLAASVTEMEMNKNAYTKYEQQRVTNKDWKQTKRVGLQGNQRAVNCNSCQKTCVIYTHTNDHQGGGFNPGQMIAPIVGAAVFPVPVVGAVLGGVARSVFSRKKRRQRRCQVPQITVCQQNGCSHPMQQHALESTKIQTNIDEDMKKLYEEAISKTEDAKPKIIKSQEEILSCSTTIAQTTVELLNHSKTVEKLTKESFLSIDDLRSQLSNEISLGEADIIPQAIKYIAIVTEAMATLASLTAEEVLGKHELVKEMLLKDYEDFFP
ncbi:uncharacterized protein LOC123510630 [Portunus trituberculatus]|uniref:uncharacterized protein LOC123510630 n=1 Tax=Portunus trituberculatus TaxID=210409 RepID=UPI001E1CE772|nr:uncharacterized protein LOC123510630 [Portunus trituberculatus]